MLAIGDDFSKLQIQSVAATSKLENAIGKIISALNLGLCHISYFTFGLAERPIKQTLIVK